MGNQSVKNVFLTHGLVFSASGADPGAPAEGVERGGVALEAEGSVHARALSDVDDFLRAHTSEGEGLQRLADEPALRVLMKQQQTIEGRQMLAKVLLETKQARLCIMGNFRHTHGLPSR